MGASSPTGTTAGYPLEYTSGQKADNLTMVVNENGSESKGLNPSTFYSKYGFTSSQVTIGYQWYQMLGSTPDPVTDTAIEGATSASYAPDTNLPGGLYSYYCVMSYNVATYARPVSTIVTTTTSAVAQIQIYEAGVVAGAPSFDNSGIKDATYTSIADSIDYLSCDVTVPKGDVGTLTYQWFCADNDDPDPSTDTAVTESLPVPEDGHLTYLPSYTKLGESYYYCVVTNEVCAEAVADRTSTAISAIAHITMPSNFGISSPSDLVELSKHASVYKGYTIVLNNDIDMSSSSLTSEWKGLALEDITLDGYGHTISGLNTEDALFSSLKNCTIRDLVVDADQAGVAAIAAVASDTAFTDVITKGTIGVEGDEEDLGGLVCDGYNLSFTRCGNEATINGDVDAGLSGGILCSANTACTFTNCYNLGSVSGEYAAGILAYVEDNSDDSVTSFINCYNTGALSCAEDGAAEGIVGVDYGDTPEISITNCYNAGALLAGNSADGGAICDERSSVSEDNDYCLSDLGWDYTGDATVVSSEELRTMDPSTTLSSAYKEGSGYPVLAWQIDHGAYPVVTAGTTEVKTVVGTAFEPLAVTASFMDGIKDAYKGTLSYQWYSNTRAAASGGKAITDATEATYTPSSAAIGTVYYYCVVANNLTTTTRKTTSALFTAVTTSGLPDAAAPVITTQPASTTYEADDQVQPLTIEATSSDGGTLSYQWYTMAGTTPSALNDTAISGATSASYTPADNTNASYYCIVTNSASNKESVSVTSEVAKLTFKKIIIHGVLEFAEFVAEVNSGNDYNGITVALENRTYDMTTCALTANNWKGITGTFKGNFDGNGAVLKGLDLTGGSKNTSLSALFSTVSGGTIEDFTLIADLDGAMGGAGLVVNNLVNGMVSNVTVKGSIDSSSASVLAVGAFGGIAGTAENSIIKDCDANVEINGAVYVGGIAGTAQASIIEDCTVAGSITSANTTSTAGIVGYASDVDIVDCGNAAAVTLKPSTTGSAAGIVATLEGGSITACKNSGDIAGLSATAGIVAVVSDNVEVESCYNTGAISYVTASSCVYSGGLVGYLQSGCNIYDSYNTGAVTGAGDYIGALVARGSGFAVSNCYYTPEAYPEDGASIIQADSYERLCGKDFVADLNDSNKFYAYNPNGTPALYWETPHYLSDATLTVVNANSIYYNGGPAEPELSVVMPYGEGTLTLTEDDYDVIWENNEAPGTATVTVTGTGDFTGSLSTTFQIKRGKLTITADSFTKTVGEADPEFTYTVDGLAEGEEIRYLTIERGEGETAGTYTLTPTLGIVVNGKKIVTSCYDITCVPGTLTIEAAVTPEPTPTPTPTPVKKTPKLGDIFKIGTTTYRVTNLKTKTVTLTKCTAKGKYTVAASVKYLGVAFKVTAIKASAFKGAKVTSVIGGTNLTIINNYAFRGCTKMTLFKNTSTKLTKVGSYAFLGCSKLKTFRITSAKLSKVGAFAFKNCKKLKTVIFSKTTKLTKSGVKKCLKASKVTVVKVKSTKVKAYKKIFTKANAGRKTTVKRA